MKAVTKLCLKYYFPPTTNALKVFCTKANAVLRAQLFKVVKYNNIKTIHVKKKKIMFSA